MRTAGQAPEFGGVLMARTAPQAVGWVPSNRAEDQVARKFGPDIQVLHMRHPNFNSRYCGKGGSGARNLGFGEEISFASFFPAAGAAGGAGEGRTRFCASNAKYCVLCVSM